MVTIDELEAEISELQSLIEEAGGRAAASPSAELTVISLTERLKELENRLRQEKARRRKEIVELRLRGALADTGSLPLELFSKIASGLAHAIGHTARRRKHGTEGKKLLRGIVAELDLRLEGIRGGSTCLYISGETAPDLFGRSLMEETLYETFRFLESASDELTGAVSEIGASAARSFMDVLKVVGSADLSMEVNWETPRQDERSWSIDAEGALGLANALSKVAADEPELLEIVGEVITVSSRRPLELRTAEGNDFSIQVPAILAEAIKALTVGQRVVAPAEKRTVRNEATGTSKTSYVLRGAPKPEESRP